MSNINPDLEKEFPTHTDIEKRAYELYLARCQYGQVIQDWLLAEEQLRRERRETDGHKPNGGGAGSEGVAKTGSPDNYFVIQEEEWRQVRATEKLKKQSDTTDLPGTTAVARGRPKTK